ncbi:DUF6624 domain-containing protein [Alteromonas sp. PRIM-21]|uniref:DUF6624 domain-containing protein n=1 Tax=Alteromonas sp. PRIM-21 TaxID=1454978 RepID=UPI0022B970FE|nr:DUF6624 domain-containing protein [Alteromonas sp. PRIM-21]MCZ8528706.1 hypothetical protein [Alteromonas sp. PRIM-21]
MKYFYSIVFLLIVSSPSCASEEFSDLRAELLEMMKLDQDTLHGKTQFSFEELNAEQSKRLQEIVEKFGWPTIEMVGKDASQAAWIIVQHADHDTQFQNNMLSMMRPLAISKEIDPGNYVYLYDRTHTPQLYGTQGKCEGSTFKPFPIKEIEQINARRGEMGMSSVQEYWDMASERMCGTSKR